MHACPATSHHHSIGELHHPTLSPRDQRLPSEQLTCRKMANEAHFKSLIITAKSEFTLVQNILLLGPFRIKIRKFDHCPLCQCQNNLRTPSKPKCICLSGGFPTVIAECCDPLWRIFWLWMVKFVRERAAHTRGFLTNVRGFWQVSSFLGPEQSSDLSKTYEAGVAACKTKVCSYDRLSLFLSLSKLILLIYFSPPIRLPSPFIIFPFLFLLFLLFPIPFLISLPYSSPAKD